ncbi:metallophosphoesterase [Helcobacillus massiliensis]|uniref:Calcineurin-like phosphoesterase domain-containing protein n=1 Tax=Helcobacillus massiliensis TaxID=521392 RepID=A0A839QRJ1_9MICO|nr:metallophosphoesterase [Helcobacillus massiliensis]MBB3022288.1 hypothetical protein [Helcobacillus massiliensis]
MSRRNRRRSCVSVVLAGLLVLAVAVTGWFVYDNTVSLSTTRFEVTSASKDSPVPAAFDGFTIAQVSDLHAFEHGSGNRKLIAEVQNADPDIIAITGDQISADSTPGEVELAVQTAKDLAGVAPTYFITGNHEAGYPQVDEFLQRLEDAGVVVLRNDVQRIERDGEAIEIAGIDDPNMDWGTVAQHQDHTVVTRSNLAKLRTSPETFTVLLAHRPDDFPEYTASTVSAELVLSGHLHGGLIRVPTAPKRDDQTGLVGPGGEVLPPYTAGMHTSGDTAMIISRGLGNSVAPLRLNNPFELVVVTLRAS